MRGPERAPRSLSKKQQILCGGKEERYERNPGGVPFVFHHKLLSLQKLKNLLSVSETLSDTLRGHPAPAFCKRTVRFFPTPL